ncbi:pickpocket protein 28-like [Colletes gigas]|uniref:pickpocket protein 28-like n=1 Tax=Colletes gigas TaxID=935657 RepID=UPI001C9BA24A|nr:pickpocket protein 28-like [Colletes gigas]
MKSITENGYNSYGKKQTLGYRSFVKRLKRSLRVYCENSGLHGFRYIVTSKTCLDRIAWFTICMSSIAFCVILMLRLWTQFSNNPTMTIIDTSNPIKDLQFPGITICNNNKVYKPHADVIAQKLLMNGFDTDMSNRLFFSLMKLIRPDKIEIDNTTASSALDTLGYTVEKLMLELMQPCSLLLVRCAWLGQIHDCNKIFKTVKSNEGFCCGFNYHFGPLRNFEKQYLQSTNVTEKHVQSHDSSEPLPGVGHILDVPGTGRDIGLSIALNIDGKNYKSSVRQFVGATVLTHDPIDYPDVGAQPSTLLPGHALSMTLAGTRIESSEAIRNIPLRKRMCLFDGEQHGERKYSYQTCISKCIHQNSYGYCGCLPFFYPDDHPNVRTCYLTDVDCILARRRNLSRIKLSHINDCNCLPQCNDQSYEVISESTQIGDIEFDSEITHGLNAKTTSFLYVYFRDGTYLDYRKDTIMGWDGLLASFGGIFGLCLGGSVISFIEFIYYLLNELLAVRKKRLETKNHRLPPASKLFVSAATSKVSTKKREFHAWNEQLCRQSQRLEKSIALGSFHFICRKSQTSVILLLIKELKT